LLDGVTPQQLLVMAAPVFQLHTAKAITSYSDLAARENRLLVRWLLSAEEHDIRYLLAHVLLSDQVQGAFDRIIIDAPPRQTVGAIQALCASTHLLIPTILDGLSGEAVGTYVNEVLTLRERNICPYLKLLGVVGSMTSANIGDVLERAPDSPPRLQVAEREGLAEIKKTLSRIQAEHQLAAPPIELLPEDTFIQRTASIANSAGDSLAYVSAGESVRRMFQRLGIEVARRMMD
jgi:chromosome partitioning protein